MQVDILQAISELLYQQNRLVVPGIGTFESELSPARADFALGVLYPPFKTFSFSEKTTTEDKVLSNFIASQYNLPAYQAEETVKRFVEQTETALQQRDAIFIPEVGQLYCDTTHKMWFVPEKNKNFNTQVFGLPVLEFDRISRNVTTTDNKGLAPLEASELPAYANAAQPANAILRRSIFLNITPVQILVLSSTVLLILTAALTCNMTTHSKSLSDGNTEAQAKLVSKTHINTSPTADYNTKLVEQPIESVVPDEADVPPMAVELPNETVELPKPKVVVPKKKKNQNTDAVEAEIGIKKQVANRCTMIIGCFSDKKNADYKIKTLKTTGLKIHQDKINGLIRIGISFNFSSPESKALMISRIKRQFNEQAWELK